MSTDKENKKKSDMTDTSKSDKSDISNSLEKNAKGKPGSQNPTPQARTDQEQDSENQKQQ
jgi:hypothetical protein